jgi:cell division initiation protein
LEPDDLEKKEFLVSLRGYDREEVDEYLREVAEELRRLRTASGSQARAVEIRADPTAAYRQVGQETSKILIAAEETANEIRERAKAEAAQLVSDARAEADQIVRKAQAEKQTIEEDLRRLREARNLTGTQLEDVGRRVEEMVARLRSPIEPAPPAKPPRPPAARPVEAVPPLPAPKPEPAPPKVAEKPVPSEPPPAAEPAVEVKVEEMKKEAEPAPVKIKEGAAAELRAVLEEVKREREEGRREVEAALSAVAPPAVTEASAPAQALGAAPVVLPRGVESRPEAEAAPAPAADTTDHDILTRRDSALGENPEQAARRLKRLLQDDQNEQLDRLRSHRAKGTLDENLVGIDTQTKHFTDGLGEILSSAFGAGAQQAGGATGRDSSEPVAGLISKQVVAPLRNEIAKVIEAGINNQDTATAISERVSDVYRVWKGVRTQLLGEGLVHAAYHAGMMDAWRAKGGSLKRWIRAQDERDCPKDVCKANAEAGAVAADAPFPSRHLAPPAHGGCTCTLAGAE